MKKLTIAIILGLTIVGCGEKIKITDKATKIEMAKKVISEKDEKVTKEINDIMEKLKEQSEKGEEIAYKELQEWKQTIEREIVNKKVDNWLSEGLEGAENIQF